MYERIITFNKFVRWLGWGIIILAVVLLINYLGSVLLPFAIAWLIAYLLYPIVTFVQYRLHVRNRVLSIIITLIGVTAVL
ncbi:MAG: AI-2E family transporter, partial [Prevotella sp.]|nr:AI-2E family transporter [Prevotella sp.]